MKFFFIIIFTSAVLLTFNVSNVNAKNSYFNEAKKLFDNKKYKDSKFYFEKDLVFNPKSEKSYLYLAKIFKKEEKNVLEENNLNTVLLLNPTNEEAIYLLALLNIKNSNFSKAKELINTLNSVCEKMCTSKLELQTKLDSSLKSE
jgi:Tfp pilus assembly protein PilF|tara:strand:- start:5 stop:439 length:435 start_codon:yes stop_codon:yes gene_type:complete